MEISITELEKISKILLEHLKDKSGDLINIDTNFYWNIQQKDWKNIQHEPSNFEIGSIHEEYYSLKNMINENNVISYALVWYGAILRAIGEKEVS